MNNPDTYHENNNLQKQDAIKVLKDNIPKIKWNKSKIRIIDIGSGDGEVTAHILTQYIPTDYKLLVGCDVNEKMIQYANKNYSNEKITFVLCDIGDHLPDKFKNSFDYAFSFYAINWVLNQHAAFMNIYNLLVDGGNCLLMFSSYNPVFTIYQTLAKTSKWCFWLTDVDRFITPYQSVQNPDIDVLKIMKQTGFKNIEVTPLQRTFLFDSTQSFKNFIASVNPFRIPEDTYKIYLEDFIQLVRDNHVQDIEVYNNGADCSYRINYGVLVAYGLK